MLKVFSLATYFEMPKGTKAPPPQQSKLEEMWGKKKVAKTEDQSGETAQSGT